jgi:single-strand DNA-binding protein
MNKVMLIGNVGKEPEVRYVDKGMAVARLSLATTERGYTLANGTQVPDRTDWHYVVLWRKLAEVVEKYVHKGDKLYIEGRIRYTSFNDKQGVKHNMTEIWAENMEMLTPKSQSAIMPKSDDAKQSASSAMSQTQANEAEDAPF